jgi:ABC-type glutathione transport system ATPase component
MPSLITLDRVSKNYVGGLLGRGRQPALHPLTLDVAEDQLPVIAVVGESGSGKRLAADAETSGVCGLPEPEFGAIPVSG